jgi:adenylate cyclase
MLRGNRRQRLLPGLAIGVIIAIALSLASQFGLLYSSQLKSGDFFFRAASLSNSSTPDDRIVIVALDDKSLEKLGHISKWPRSYYARLTDKLAREQARVIAFDVLFAEPSEDDGQLAVAIENAGNVILPLLQAPTENRSMLGPETTSSFRLVQPLASLSQEAAALGHANVLPDVDGVVRRLPLVLSTDDHQPSLALATAATYLRRPEVIESPVKDNGLPFTGRLIPLTDGNRMLINFIQNRQAPGGIVKFQAVSFVDVLNDEYTSSLFADKIVIIGATASGLGDTFWTPMGRVMNGVEIHASAIHTILSGNFLRSAPPLANVMLIVLLALLSGFLVLRLRVLWASVSVIFMLIVYVLLAFSLFDSGILLNLLYPPLSVASTFLGTNVYNVVFETAVVDKILAGSAKGELNLEGEEQEVTVLFADIRGFTGIAETIPPAQLLKVLNIHLAVVIDAILQYDGVINKFGGDSVMAIWNVPVKCEGHPILAVEAAVKAQQAVAKIQETEADMARMVFGIGINTGRAIVGNIGTRDRLEYSVVGDTVNTAARIASGAPGGRIWISEQTFEQVKNHVQVKPLEALSVKGKQEPVQIYEVLNLQSLMTG